MAASFNLAGIGLVLVLFLDEIFISFSSITPIQRSYSNYGVYDADFVDTKPNELLFDAYYQGPSEGFEQILWGYHDPIGPNMWPYLFADECAQRRQSPINIVTARAVRASIPQVILFGYNARPNKMKAFNNGHIIKFKVKGVQKVPHSMTQSDATSYDIEDIHFHWGSHNFQGSEHTLDGRRFAAEMHIVHKLRGKTFSESAKLNGGVTVLGVFIDVGPDDNPAYEPLIESLQHIIYKNDTHKFMYNYPLRSLLPSNTKEFMRYEGSLTTPMCDEIVLWTLFRHPVQISWRQIVQLRGLHRTRRDEMPPLPMTDNWRPTQPLNGRAVYRVGF
ncbi:Carbonic anhydrase 12 [Holothuria leucospilota]|uniref:Carbonic anhydrase n=1 Tax=Holothuria leucospilota TaxID=206669 RepID=A0A9Q1C800_HOLLE|nr:Carbonic anhydrase 12 [Holothuria leucospilota]